MYVVMSSQVFKFLFQYIDRELEACEHKFLKQTFRETLLARIEDESKVVLSFKDCER